MNFRRKEKALILSRTSSECLNQDTELQLNPSKVPSITELLATGHK